MKTLLLKVSVGFAKTDCPSRFHVTFERLAQLREQATDLVSDRSKPGKELGQGFDALRVLILVTSDPLDPIVQLLVAILLESSEARSELLTKIEHLLGHGLDPGFARSKWAQIVLESRVISLELV